MKMIHLIIIGVVLVAFYILFLKPKEAREEITVTEPRAARTAITETDIGCGVSPCQ